MPRSCGSAENRSGPARHARAFDDGHLERNPIPPQAAGSRPRRGPRRARASRGGRSRGTEGSSHCDHTDARQCGARNGTRAGAVERIRAVHQPYGIDRRVQRRYRGRALRRRARRDAAAHGTGGVAQRGTPRDGDAGGRQAADDRRTVNWSYGSRTMASASIQQRRALHTTASSGCASKQNSSAPNSKSTAVPSRALRLPSRCGWRQPHLS